MKDKQEDKKKNKDRNMLNISRKPTELYFG